MADKPISTISQSIVTTVVNALAEAVHAAKNSGTVLTTFCDAAAKAKFPKIPNEADVVRVVDALAAALHWNGTKREKVSKSEARNIVRQHATLPELMSALTASPYGMCGYHDAVKLCRLFKEKGNVPATIKAFNAKKKAKPVDTEAAMVRTVQAHYQTVSEQSASAAKSKTLKIMCDFADAMGFEIVKAAEEIAA